MFQHTSTHDSVWLCVVDIRKMRYYKNDSLESNSMLERKNASEMVAFSALMRMETVTYHKFLYMLYILLLLDELLLYP
jgi:hypothetical protein